MINANHTQGFGAFWDFDVDDGVGESSVDSVDWNWVVRICGVAGNIGDDGQLSFEMVLDVFESDEHGSGLGQVDTIDEDIRYKSGPLRLGIYIRESQGMVHLRQSLPYPISRHSHQGHRL